MRDYSSSQNEIMKKNSKVQTPKQREELNSSQSIRSKVTKIAGLNELKQNTVEEREDDESSNSSRSSSSESQSQEEEYFQEDIDLSNYYTIDQVESLLKKDRKQSEKLVQNLKKEMDEINVKRKAHVDQQFAESEEQIFAKLVVKLQKVTDDIDSIL